MKSLLSMEDLTNEEILSLVKRALDLKKGAENKKRKDLFVANLFFENSTRTKKSFEVAEKKLNLNVIDLKYQLHLFKREKLFMIHVKH
jgi:aspartate carbamoyltransferase